MRKKAAPAKAVPGDADGEAHLGQEAPSPAEARYVLQLEEENRRLKLAVADLTLRNQALKRVVGKKW